jgi:hypothetical protein
MVIGVASGVLVILSGCVPLAPTSLQPSVSPSPPSPSAPGAADVLIAVDDAHISYAVERCPVMAWLDEAIQDDMPFGTFPEYLSAEDGTRWSTHMVVMQIENADVTDWSFVLTTPLTGKPGDAERRLISSGNSDSVITASFTGDSATFTTAFWDSASAGGMTPRPLPGTVTVTCR